MNRNPRVRALLLLCIATVACNRCEAADIAAVWDASFLNNWSDASRWTTTPDVSPVVPNNGAQTYEATIQIGNVIVDVPGGVEVNSLHLIDAFLSGAAPFTIVGEPGAPSTWVGGAQNSEIWNTAGVTVGSGAELIISGGGTKRLGLNQNNNAVDDVVSLMVGGRVELGGSGSLESKGEGAVIDVLAGGAFDWVSAADLSGFTPGQLNIAGTLTRSGAAGTAQVSSNWAVHNAGSISVTSGVLQFMHGNAGFVNEGELAVSGAGAELRLGGGQSTGPATVGADAILAISTGTNVTHTFTGAAAVVTNNGTLRVQGGLAFEAGAALTGSGAVLLQSGALAGAAPIEIGSLTWSGGTIASTGGVTIPAGQAATVTTGVDKFLGQAAKLTISGTASITGEGDLATNAPAATPAVVEVSASGVLDIKSNADLSSSVQPGRGGRLVNNGTLRKSAGAGVSQVESVWAIDNHGLIDVQAGTLQIDSAFTHSADSAVTVAAGGALSFTRPVTGGNDFAGDGLVRFSDDYSPGVGAAEVEFAGDVSFDGGSELIMELTGAGAGQFDTVSIAGDLDFDGALRVVLAEAAMGGGTYTPAVGASYTLLSVGGTMTASNAFFSATLPPTPANTAWELAPDAHTLVLSLIALDAGSESGDFNSDGLVNAADYTVWRDNLGLGGGVSGSLTLADGDANNDGFVNNADYAVWRAHYGATSARVGPEPAPEPAALALVVIGATALARRRSP